jgi:hypothetical protein
MTQQISYPFEKFNGYSDDQFIESIKNYIRPLANTHIEQGTRYYLSISSTTDARLKKLRSDIFSEFNYIAWSTQYKFHYAIVNTPPIELELGYESPADEDLYDPDLDDGDQSPRSISDM